WILLNMLTSIQAKGAELAMLEVRAGNQAAINLYSRLGFQEVGVRKRYYEDNHEDALLLTLDNIQYDFVWRDLGRRRNSVACEIRLKFGPSLEERIEMGERLGYDAEF
ncbi:MAG: hypothetical protein HC802_02445, partial [Caldilineaceae bacterium]|nr:hypothetical protein [Caldilineaceae bacterium]